MQESLKDNFLNADLNPGLVRPEKDCLQGYP